MKKKLTITLTVILAGLVAVGLLLLKDSTDLRSKARRAWKDNAVADIARRIGDETWLTTERNKLKRQSEQTSPDSDAWLSENMILMTNGQWIVYANLCNKENWRIQDIFIGRGSDGKWYYSTYHFCKRMIVLRMEEQSKSLADFIEAYYLREFDGRSDECLNKTWPPSQK